MALLALVAMVAATLFVLLTPPQRDDVRVVGLTKETERGGWVAALGRYDDEMSREGDPYPLGAHDSFRLRHGANYFAFFERMSREINVRLCVAGDRVVASGAGVLRQVPPDWRRPLARLDAWYVCDLRVAAAYRGKRLPSTMLASTVFGSYWRCRRCFGVTMDVAKDSVVGRLASRVRSGPVRWTPACRLLLYAVDATTMRRAEPILVAGRGPLYYRSLRGVKDLVLTSSGQPMCLLHVNFRRYDVAGDGRPDKSCLSKPVQNFTHMFCLPDGDPIALLLEQQHIRSHASARVFAYNMSEFDFTFIQTSDI